MKRLCVFIFLEKVVYVKHTSFNFPKDECSSILESFFAGTVELKTLVSPFWSGNAWVSHIKWWAWGTFSVEAKWADIKLLIMTVSRRAQQAEVDFKQEESSETRWNSPKNYLVWPFPGRSGEVEKPVVLGSTISVVVSPPESTGPAAWVPSCWKALDMKRGSVWVGCNQFRTWRCISRARLTASSSDLGDCFPSNSSRI